MWYIVAQIELHYVYMERVEWKLSGCEALGDKGLEKILQLFIYPKLYNLKSALVG